MEEFIVSTTGRTYIKRPGNMGFLHEKSYTNFNESKTEFIAYKGKNEIKAKYIALKTHYNICVEKGETNEYGLAMLIMDIKYYEERHPEWCL